LLTARTQGEDLHPLIAQTVADVPVLMAGRCDGGREDDRLPQSPLSPRRCTEAVPSVYRKPRNDAATTGRVTRRAPGDAH
jgi:hypothetical protein